MAERDPAAERLLAAYRTVRSPNEAETRAAFMRMRERIDAGAEPAIDLDARRIGASKIAIAAVAIAAVVALTWWLDVGGSIARRQAGSEPDAAAYQGTPGDEQQTDRAVLPGDGEATPQEARPEETPLETRPDATPRDPRARAIDPPSDGAGEAADSPPEIEADAETKPARAAPRLRAAPPTEATGDASLHAEMALLSSAQSALAAGNPARALKELDRHARRFPASLLSEEREVARIRALCALGKDDALKAARRRFDRRFPGSPLRGRAMAECAPKEEDAP